MTTRIRLSLGLMIGTALVSAVFVFTTANAQRLDSSSAAAGDAMEGQTATLLPDGRWLLLGGERAGSPSHAAAIVDPSTGETSVLSTSMIVARTRHTATVLPDGTVLIVGGRQAARQLAQVPELFDPDTGAFMPIAIDGAIARAGHSATLLSDGRVLVTGGAAAGDRLVRDVEIWDVRAQRASSAGRLPSGRSEQTATLLDDGRVALTGGIDAAGRAVTLTEIVDPATGQVMNAAPRVDDWAPPRVTASMPADGAVDVPVDVRVAMRFSRPLRVTTVTPETVHLYGEEGLVDARVVPAEGGRLVFVTPRVSLRDDAAYTINLVGASDVTGQPLVVAPVGFVTAKAPVDGRAASTDEESWVPDARSREHGWRTDRPASPWESLPPLMAPPGVTAISGRVLTLDGQPLAGVSLSVEGDGEVHSDRTGRFLLGLKPLPTARRVLRIDGAPASKPNRRYGFFEYGTTVRSGITNVLPFTIWQPKLDTAHQVTIAVPTPREVVVTTPSIPGLELHLPAGTTIRDEGGKPVTTLGITAIPVDRPPFPLAKNVSVPVYFTIQPGGAYVQTGAAPTGAWVVYPNYKHFAPEQRVQFFHYDPEVKDWFVYGMGTANAAQVVPDVTTRIYKFTGAMFSGSGSPPPEGPPPGDCCGKDGDPVDLATGLFTLEATDLSVPDLIPIALTRTYRQRDVVDRPFGAGMTHPYAMFVSSEHQYTEADLIEPDGGRVHYVRISSGDSWENAVFVHQETGSTSATPTAFYKSTMRWNGNGWDLVTIDGTVYVFGENAPLQAIRDRYGNQVTIFHDNGQGGNVTQVVSPNGRWLKFSYANGHISQVADNIGRTVAYTYDSSGNLSTVTDPENHATSYTYDDNHRMVGVKPPSLQGTQTNLVTNEYTTSADAPTPVGWVKKQTHADGGVYQFAYTFVNGKISQALVTDPRGKKRRVTFNTDGYTVADQRAVDETEQQGDTSVRTTRSNFIMSATNSHGDETATEYDALGRVSKVTRLPGTADEAITTYTYDPIWKSEIATITDPLNHTTTFEYDERGNRKSVIDALNHKTSFTFNAAGQVTSVTDPLQHMTTYDYLAGDLVKITDPLGHVTRRFFDAAGRLLSQTDAAGHMTRVAYDKMNHATEVTDPLNGITHYGYDSAGRLSSVTDALNHTTGYGYDQFDRLASRTDPLSKTETFTYDVDGNPYQRTDRKAQVTTRTYDALDRLQQTTYADNSTITYGYDSGNRLTSITDSLNGSITRMYDNLDRLLSETTLRGSITYTYDKADRRKTMTVDGQPKVTYGYDDANRLTSITQETGAAVIITYDAANRRSTLTLPNGIQTAYTYDDGSQLIGLTYTLGQTTLGTLTYAYDPAGLRVEAGGTWARIGLPQALSSATYDEANRLTQSAGSRFSYDANGNLASDGLTSYTWNVRNQLSTISGSSSSAFQYDAVQRRFSKTAGGQTVQFLYDGANAVQELSNGTPLANVLSSMAFDETWSRTDAQGTRFPLVDGLGSTLALTDGLGVPVTQYTYEPFGQTTRTGTTSTNTAQFTGRDNDAPASELYFYRARYFSTSTQRFISEDPIEFAGGTNLYTYTHNDPVNFDDPSGTCDCSVRVRCRPAFGKVANFWHCYIVVKTRQGEYRTLTGGHDKDWMLAAWDLPGDPVGDNSFTDSERLYRKSAAMCDTVDCLKAKVPWVNGLGLQYHTFTQNSNSFVSWAMQLCGLPVNLPWWASGRDQ